MLKEILERPRQWSVVKTLTGPVEQLVLHYQELLSADVAEIHNTRRLWLGARRLRPDRGG